MPPDPLATAFHPSMNSKFAVAWAASSFIWYSDKLLLASLRNSFLLDSPHKQSNAFWRKKKGLRFNRFPIRIRGNTFTHLSHRRGGLASFAVFTIPSNNFRERSTLLFPHPYLAMSTHHEDVHCCCSARFFLSRSSRSLQHRSIV